MSRICLDFCFRHVPGTRDPLEAEHPWYVLLELQSGLAGTGPQECVEEALAAALDAGAIEDAAVATSEAQAYAMWKLRESIPEAELREGGGIKHDVSVPLPDVPAFLDRATRAVGEAVPGARVVAFGHLGDGNIHFNVGPPTDADKEAFLARWGAVNEIVHDIVASFGGQRRAWTGPSETRRDRPLQVGSGDRSHGQGEGGPGPGRNPESGQGRATGAFAGYGIGMSVGDAGGVPAKRPCAARCYRFANIDAPLEYRRGLAIHLLMKMRADV